MVAAIVQTVLGCGADGAFDIIEFSENEKENPL